MTFEKAIMTFLCQEDVYYHSRGIVIRYIKIEEVGVIKIQGDLVLYASKSCVPLFYAPAALVVTIDTKPLYVKVYEAITRCIYRESLPVSVDLHGCLSLGENTYGPFVSIPLNLGPLAWAAMQCRLRNGLSK